MAKKKTVKGPRGRKSKKKAKPSAKRPRTTWSRLSAVSLRNFKRFAHLPSVLLSPLTFVTGPNSSGKSSLIQSLVLLKQSLEATTSVEQLVFDDMVKLGSFDRLICDTPSDPPDSFEICIHVSLEGFGDNCKKDVGKEYAKACVSFIFAKESRLKKDVTSSVLQELHVGLVDEDGTVVPFITFTRVGSLKDRQVHYEIIGSEHHTGRIEYAVEQKSEWFTKRFIADMGGKVPWDLDEGVTAAFDRLLPVGFRAPMKSDTQKVAKSRRTNQPKSISIDLPLEIPNPFVQFVINEARTILSSSLFYVGPLRVEPEFLYTQTSKRIGVRGEDSMAYLRANRSRLVSKGMPSGDTDSLLDCVDKWLINLKVSEGLRFEEQGDIYFEPMTGDRHLPEVGCGVGQILPVIVQCLASEPGSTILLEQPEIHLHQSLQAGMCDFFLAQMRRGIRIVVETHSEIMIQRLRRRIAEDTTGEIHRRCKVFFVPRESTEFVDIGIDPAGHVAVWPEMFFDQGIAEMRALAEAQNKLR